MNSDTIKTPEQEPVNLDYVREERLQNVEDRTVGEVLLRVAYFAWPRRRFIAWFVTIFVFLTTVGVLLWPKTYTAHAALAPPDNKLSTALGGLGSSGAGSSLGMELLALGGLKDPTALYTAMLRSRTVEDDLINRFDLRKVYGLRYYEVARKKLEKRTSVVQDIKSGVTTIEVEDRDPYRARDLAQGYIDELNRMVAGLNTSAAHRERVFIEDRLKVVKKALDESAQAFSQFASKNTAIDIQQQAKAMVDAAATLQGELIVAQSELKGLEQIYAPDNIRVQSLRARVKELEAQLKDMGGSPSAAAGNGNGSTSAMEYPTLRQLPILGVKYFDLYRESKIQEQVYEILTKQYELAKVEEAKETPTIGVIDFPQVPERKSFPPRTMLVTASVPLSLGIALLWVYVADRYARMDADQPARIIVARVAEVIHSRRSRRERTGKQDDVWPGR